jgi:predicted Zn-dependent protease
MSSNPAGSAGPRSLGRPQDAVEAALSATTSENAVVIVDEVTTANLRFASNTLTTNGVTYSRDVTFLAFEGPRVAVVSRQGVDQESLIRLVEQADALAREASPAEDAAPLAGPDSSLGDWGAAPEHTSVSVFEATAKALGEQFHKARASGRLLFGFALHEMRSSFMGSSTGLRCRWDQPSGQLEMNAKSADYRLSAWGGVPTRDFADVDPAALAESLERRLGWAARSVELPAGRYDTILPPSAVADMMIYLYWSASGRDAHDGRSVFSRAGGGTRVGERLSDAALTLGSDPARPGIACSPYVTAYQSGGSQSVFDNGLATPASEWISNGVLSALVQSRHSASLTKLPFTPYVDNLYLEANPPSAHDEEHLVAGLERGLLLTCLWYIREVDPRTLLLTGLTRDGVYLVEGGEVVGAVNNFRFNESPLDLLARAQAATGSAPTLAREWGDYFARVSMPSLLVEGFNMSSVSQAS